MSALRIRESNPRTWRPFNPASIIGMSRIRGCLQERAPSQPPRPATIAAIKGGRRGRGSCFLATTHYFLVVAFDVDGLGHSKRLIENFLRLENGARNVIGGRVAIRHFIRRFGVKKEECIYLTSRIVWSLRTTSVAVRGNLYRIIPSSSESRRTKSRKKDTHWKGRAMSGKN